jgi:hypothetical protein
MVAGNGRTTGDGGIFVLTGGNAAGIGAVGRRGGGFGMFGGEASFNDTTGFGGGCQASGGAAYNAGSRGGDLLLTGGSGDLGADGGDVSLEPGAAVDVTGLGGDLILCVGYSAGGVPADQGVIKIQNNGGFNVAVAADPLLTHTQDLPVIVDGVQRYIRLYS